MPSTRNKKISAEINTELSKTKRTVRSSKSANTNDNHSVDSGQNTFISDANKGSKLVKRRRDSSQESEITDDETKNSTKQSKQRRKSESTKNKETNVNENSQEEEEGEIKDLTDSKKKSKTVAKFREDNFVHMDVEDPNFSDGEDDDHE